MAPSELQVSWVRIRESLTNKFSLVGEQEKFRHLLTRAEEILDEAENKLDNILLQQKEERYTKNVEIYSTEEGRIDMEKADFYKFKLDGVRNLLAPLRGLRTRIEELNRAIDDRGYWIHQIQTTLDTELENFPQETQDYVVLTGILDINALGLLQLKNNKTIYFTLGLSVHGRTGRLMRERAATNLGLTNLESRVYYVLHEQNFRQLLREEAIALGFPVL